MAQTEISIDEDMADTYVQFIFRRGVRDEIGPARAQRQTPNPFQMETVEEEEIELDGEGDQYDEQRHTFRSKTASNNKQQEAFEKTAVINEAQHIGTNDSYKPQTGTILATKIV